jgi:hypothetical protein
VHLLNLLDLAKGNFDTAVVVLALNLLFQPTIFFDEDLVLQLA